MVNPSRTLSKATCAGGGISKPMSQGKSTPSKGKMALFSAPLIDDDSGLIIV